MAENNCINAALPVAIDDGGTGSADAATARANLGLAIGADVQAQNNSLQTISNLPGNPNSVILGIGGDWSEADPATARTALGLEVGLDIQAQSAGLQGVADLTDPGADRILFWDASLNAYNYLAVGTNLTITDTTIDATGGSGITRAQATAITLIFGR